MPLIRAFRPSDADAVIALLTATMRSTWVPQMSESARANIDIGARIRGYIEAMGDAFILAEQDGRVAGMIHWQDDFIHALHIDPAAQRQGIGTALLRHAENAMSISGVKIVRLETDTFNTQSRAFYGRHGYKEKDRYPDTQWDSGFTTILLEKVI